MKIKIKRSKENGEFYAVLLADNGKQVWKTPETYKRRKTVDRAIDILLDIRETDVEIIDETK